MSGDPHIKENEELHTELKRLRLDHLASERQWIEHSGKLAAEVERLTAAMASIRGTLRGILDGAQDEKAFGLASLIQEANVAGCPQSHHWGLRIYLWETGCLKQT